MAVFESGCCLSSSAQNRDLGMLSRSADNLPIYALLGSNNGEMTVTFSNHLKLICLLSWYVNVSSFLLNSENICASLLENFPFMVSVVPFLYSFPVLGNSCILCCVWLQVCKKTGHEAGFKGAVYIDCPMKPCFLCKMPGSHIYVCVIISLCFWSTRVTNFGCFFLCIVDGAVKDCCL